MGFLTRIAHSHNPHYKVGVVFYNKHRIEYMITKWRVTKNDFLVALNTAKLAREYAEEHISSACGQKADFFSLLCETEDKLEMKGWLGEPYSRPASLTGRIKIPDPNKHWPVSLSGVRMETEFLQMLRTPDSWESLWASSQE